MLKELSEILEMISVLSEEEYKHAEKVFSDLSLKFNALEIKSEEVDCVNKYLDDCNVAKEARLTKTPFSVVGRIKYYVDYTERKANFNSKW